MNDRSAEPEPLAAAQTFAGYAPAPESTSIVTLADRYDLWIGGE